MEPIRDVFNQTSITIFAKTLAKHVPGFDRQAFVSAALHNLNSRSLMARSDHLSTLLQEQLPSFFPEAAALLQNCLHPHCHGYASAEASPELGIQGWLILPIADYAGRNGGDHLPIALDLLAQCTMRFTAEFGIRHLWFSQPDEVMSIVQHWTSHENEHVRRLASEGSRPILPWGKRLPLFIKEPERTMTILSALIDDPSAYVRKSVANHLNDITRHHPELVIDFAQKWLTGASTARQRLLRHALRNLLKKGHPRALALYELSMPVLKHALLRIDRNQLAVGDSLEVHLELVSAATNDQSLRIDLVVYYQRANGSWHPKVFRWKDLALPTGSHREIKKTLSFRPISTRTYYAGTHRLAVQINGEIFASTDFTLTKDSDVISSNRFENSSS